MVQGVKWGITTYMYHSLRENTFHLFLVLPHRKLVLAWLTLANFNVKWLVKVVIFIQHGVLWLVDSLQYDVVVGDFPSTWWANDTSFSPCLHFLHLFLLFFLLGSWLLVTIHSLDEEDNWVGDYTCEENKGSWSSSTSSGRPKPRSTYVDLINENEISTTLSGTLAHNNQPL